MSGNRLASTDDLIDLQRKDERGSAGGYAPLDLDGLIPGLYLPEIVGEPGPAGAVGPAGPPGDTGPAGADGAPGTPGAPGQTGPKGDTGDTGPAGAPGSPGVKGDTGQTGPKGDKGDPGDVGPQGLKGDTGPAGPGGETHVKLTADHAAFALVALSNVTGLAFNVVAGTTYRFRALVVFRSAATTTGIRLGLTCPAASVLSAKAEIPIAADAAAATMFGWITSSGDSVLGTGVQAAATDYLAEITGVITPTAAGTVQIQAATEIAASAITVRAGTHLSYTAV